MRPRRYTLKENAISALIGAAIGLPLALYANAHRTPVEHPPIQATDYYVLQEEAAVTDTVDMIQEQPASEAQAEPLVAVEDTDLDLMAALIHAEAGNQDLTGKRLVADVVLNRVDSDQFADTIGGVIHEEHGGVWQFTTAGNGALEQGFTDATPEDYEAARLEMEGDRRLDYDILFFTAGGYNPYCVPMYVHGDHYFGR